MRKRLSVVTAAMIFACAISPVAVWAEESPTTKTTTTTEETAEETAENDIETLDLDVQDAPAVYGAPPTPTTTVATVGEQPYDSLQAAIDAANGQDIVLQSDVALTTGLKFSGTAGAPIDQWKTFTIDANGHNITMTDVGIGATNCNVIIKDCPNLTIKASKNPGASTGIAACYFGHATLTLNNCTNVTITNDLPEDLRKDEGGSGICVYDEGSLYFQNNTNVTISEYMFRTENEDGDLVGASGIYMDCDNRDYTAPIGSINVTDHSTLTVTHCFHNGITANPANITVTDSSVLDVSNNNDGWYGEGGLGCYFGKLTVSKGSRVTANKNSSWGFAIFVKDLEVDGNSEIDANDNGGYGLDGGYLTLGSGYGVTVCGSAFIEGTVNASGNWGPGLATFNYGTGDRSLTVRNGGKIICSNNFNYGIDNDGVFTVEPGGTVTLEKNWRGGLDNYPGATLIVEEKANFTASENYGMGINNGNADSDYLGDPSKSATLVLKSGVITKNHNGSRMPIPGFQPLGWSVPYGGGICNRYGTVDISAKTEIYNNHASSAGDDLYNFPLTDAKKPNKITLTIPGAVWKELDEISGGGIIDNWYDDSENNRWNAATHAVICEDSKSSDRFTLPKDQPAWKAAHGAVAPTPSPSPTPEASATPVPTNEPSPVPSASPVPSTPMPSAVPTAAPTAAPVQPTTAPVAPVTHVDATATPAPTDAPTQQPTATIPQTGDAAPLALFGGLTISSAAAFYFLRKRRKSE